MLLLRWASFRQLFEEIDVNVKAMCINNEIVKYQCHIGGGRYVSVTTGFPCVDFRKFFVLYGQQEIKPTRQGIALRLNEWMEMRKTIETINDAHPTLGTALPCYMQDDHNRARGKSHHPIARHFFVENVAFVVKGAETTWWLRLHLW